VQAVTKGIDALGEVTVKVESSLERISKNPQYESEGHRVYLGHGADTDIVVASAKAYLSALNKILLAKRATAELQQVEKTA
jgi:2-isopropylmalate synthase